MKFYTRFNLPPNPGAKLDPKTMTCQEFKDECDINNIVKKPNYGINPLNPPTRVPSFGDFTDERLKDYQAAQNVIVEAAQLFEQLPSQVRERFSNDPAKLIDFVNNKDNYEEAVKLGMIDVPLNELPLEQLTPSNLNGSPGNASVQASSAGSEEVAL